LWQTLSGSWERIASSYELDYIWSRDPNVLSVPVDGVAVSLRFMLRIEGEYISRVVRIDKGSDVSLLPISISYHPLTAFAWMWQTGNGFRLYSIGHQMILEDAWQRGDRNVVLTPEWSVDTRTWMQTNVKTSFLRDVTRIPRGKVRTYSIVLPLESQKRWFYVQDECWVPCDDWAYVLETAQNNGTPIVSWGLNTANVAEMCVDDGTGAVKLRRCFSGEMVTRPHKTSAHCNMPTFMPEPHESALVVECGVKRHDGRVVEVWSDAAVFSERALLRKPKLKLDAGELHLFQRPSGMVPRHWLTDGTREDRLVALNAGDTLYMKVAAPFWRTGRMDVQAIYSVENIWLRKLYHAKVEHTEAETGVPRNELQRVAYHGTTNHNHVLSIANRGFTRAFTTRHVHGQGVYFGSDVITSAAYTGEGSVRYMFQVTLLASEMVENHNAERVCNKNLATVFTNRTRNPNIFAATTEHQAYPDFMIQFRWKP
jgi:hypothetical protein